MQMKAKLTSQNHDLDTKYRNYRKLLFCITFDIDVASNFAGKMKVFGQSRDIKNYKLNLLDPQASPSLKLPSPTDPPFTNWLSIISIKNTDENEGKIEV